MADTGIHYEVVGSQSVVIHGQIDHGVVHPTVEKIGPIEPDLNGSREWHHDLHIPYAPGHPDRVVAVDVLHGAMHQPGIKAQRLQTDEFNSQETLVRHG